MIKFRNVFVAILFAACVPWHGPQALQTMSGKESQDIFAMNAAASQLVAVQSYKVEHLDGRLGVHAELVNLSSLDLAIQVRTIFLDKDQVLLEESGHWEMLVIPGAGSRLYQCASLSDRAMTAQVEVKTP